MSNVPVPQTPGDALSVREKAAAARAEVTRTVQDIKRRQDDAKAELDHRRAELEADFRRQAAELETQMKPLQDQLAKMQEVLWTVNLYLGRDETLQLLREGTPAPSDTPISIRQRVLVMAEESLVMTGGKMTGMDAKNVPEFVNWLLADDTHLNRVLPEPKGVVVLIPTKVASRTGNVFEDAFRDAANQCSYWLLRNGQRLHLLTVDPDLRIYDRVLPRRTEFTEVFDRGLFGYGRSAGTPVEPGSEEWLAMEKVADARQRHYMRILLVLQGVIDRTPVWYPLPEGGVSLLRMSDQEFGRIQLIQDGDDSLQITDGREDFRSWQRRLNAQLRPGMRVIGNWGSRGFRDLYKEDGQWGRGGHPRLYPGNVGSLPDSEAPYLIEDRRDGGLVIRFARTDEVWRKLEEPVPGRPGYVYRHEDLVTPTQRASLVIMADDDWVLPYDLVTPAELQAYLDSRENRSAHFLSMVPTIQAALAAKRAEAAAEAPFRDLLQRMLEAEAEGADRADSARLVEELVHWWKVANTWARPLNGEPKHEARAADTIVTEYRHRQGHAADDKAQAMITAGRSVTGAVAVVRKRSGQWLVYSASPGAREPGMFVDITPIRANGTLGRTEAWQTPAARTVSALHVAWSAPEWKDFRFGVNRRHILSEPERESIIRNIQQTVQDRLLCITEFHDPAAPADRYFAAYTWTGEQPPAQTEIITGYDPLSWRAGYSGRTSLSGFRVWKIAHQENLSYGLKINGAPSRIPTSFRHFAGGSRWGDTPWWPDDARRYVDVRPRLVWADEQAMDEVKAYEDRRQEAFKAERAARKRREAEAYRYVRPIQAAILDQLTAQARERFAEDYGTEAEDLWESHFASLRLSSPIHDRTLWGIVAIRLEKGLPVTGLSLGELAEFAHVQDNRAPGEWHPDRGVQDMHGHEDLITPEPEPDPEG